MEEEAKVPAWLVTFSDLMTLLLTFFVLLLSMSVVDEEKKLKALGSVHNAFGFIEGVNVLEKQQKLSIQKAGKFTKQDIKDLNFEESESIKHSNEDLTFLKDRDVYILRLSSEIFFARGSYKLTDVAKNYIRSMLPLVMKAKHPIKIVGNASTLFDEFGTTTATTKPSPLWKLSLYRALAVYKFMHQEGVPYEKMLFEGIATHNKFLKKKNSLSNLEDARSVNIILHKEDSQVFDSYFYKDERKNFIEIDGFEFYVPQK